jgi:hypothetical protein
MKDLTEYFIQQLNEAAETNKQKHLEHPEDLAYDGHEGVGLADQHLRMMHNHLVGRKRDTPDRVETKVDGAPAFHIFKDNEGRIGVGTKSIFNKEPKLNFTEEDIDRNHGHAPGLADVLKQLLTHAHKMVPSDMKPGEIYKGDFLYGGGDTDRSVSTDENFHSFQPNTLRYKVPVDSAAGAKVANAKIGVALHTFFGPDGVAGPIDSKRRAKLMDHPDVYNYDPTVNVKPTNYSPEEQRAFEQHSEAARKAYNRIKPEVYDQLTGHDQHMRTFTNSRVREGAEGPAKVEDYLNFLNQRANKDIGSVKTQAAKDRKSKQHAALMQQITQNSKDVQNIFNLHHHLQQAKNVLVGVADKNSNEAVELPNGEATSHEGYVSTKGASQAKFVNRAEFSRNNFLYGAMQQNKQQPVEEEVSGVKKIIEGFVKDFKDLIRESPETDHVVAAGRFTPITEGHGTLIKAVTDEAEKQNASHSILVSHSQDSKKNPLSVEQKLKYARAAFPNVNFTSSSKEAPNLLHHLSDLHSKGVKNVTIVGGSDRDSFNDLAEKYNGKEFFTKEGKRFYYKFDSINFKQAGEERSDDAEGVASYSASKMRDAAMRDDRDSFHKMAPAGLSPEMKDQMMNDVKAGLTKKTKNESLVDYFIGKLLRG